MSEWIDASQLCVGDTIRLENGELLEDITAEQIESIQNDYDEVELID